MMGDLIGIVGAGITGLATAFVLSSTHKEITIIARDLPGDLSAVFHPQHAASEPQQKMQTDAFHFYWSLVHRDPSSGVKIYPMTEYRDDCIDDSKLWYKSLMPDYRVLSPSELPESVSMGVKYTTLAMNPLLHLPWLTKNLEAKGVDFLRAEIGSFDEARKLAGARLIVNASGVGAQKLAGDEAVRPIRGQTKFVKTDFEELVMRQGSEYSYVIPRMGSGGVIMGGIKSHRLDAEVDVELKSDVLKRVNRITDGAFKDLDVSSVTDIVGFRPGRKGGLRVEGTGYIYSFGVTERVRQLINGDGIKAKL